MNVFLGSFEAIGVLNTGSAFFKTRKEAAEGLGDVAGKVQRVTFVLVEPFVGLAFIERSVY